MELESIEDFCMTFQVDFMGEIAQDLSDPRKEWIRCVNCTIKDKYFDQGLLDFCSKYYFYVGLMLGIALLQNQVKDQTLYYHCIQQRESSGG